MTDQRLTRRTLLKGAAVTALGAAASSPRFAAATAAPSHVTLRRQAFQAAVTPRGGEPVSFSYLRPTWGPATYTKDGAYEKMLEEQGNAQIDVQIIPVIDFDTKVNTTLAAGDLPDVLWGLGPGVATWREAQDQGAFLPINKYLDQYAAIKGAVPDTIWAYLTAEDGNIYFVPNLIYPIVPFFLFYRQDLFEQAGIAEPKTIDEFVAALEAAKAAYADLAPFSMGYEWHAKDLATAYAQYTEQGWEPSAADPNRILPWWENEKAINLRLWLRDLQTKGLLDPNYGVNREPNFSTDNFKANKVVVAAENWLTFPDIVTNLRKIVPDAKVGVFSPLAPEAGNRAVFPVDRGFYVSARMENPDGFFDFLNWTLTAGSDLRRWGVEGKTYTVDGDRKVPITDVDREPDYRNPQLEPLRFLDPFSEKLDWDVMQLQFESAGVGDQFEYIRAKFAEYEKNEYPDYRNPYVISPTDADRGPQLFDDHLRGTVDAMIINKDLTKEDWLAAVKAWEDAGGADIINEINELQTDKSKPNYRA